MLASVLFTFLIFRTRQKPLIANLKIRAIAIVIDRKLAMNRRKTATNSKFDSGVAIAISLWLNRYESERSRSGGVMLTSLRLETETSAIL